MDIYQLYKAYKKSRKGKRRSADQVQFELNQYECLANLCDSLNSHTYAPSSNYCFIHKRNNSREVWACEVEMKIIQTVLDDYLRPLIEAKLTDRTYNNRLGYGTHKAMNRVIDDIAEVSEGYTKDAWVIKIDLKGYFPNINQDKAWELAEGLISEAYDGELRDELLRLAMMVNYANPQFNAVRRSPRHRWNDEIPEYKSLYSKPFGTGAAIGFLYWQVMSNYYLNEIDKWAIKNITPHYVRFVDDMVMVVPDKRALLMIPKLREELRKIDVSVHPRKFYCQHYAKGLEFLGYHIKKARIHVNRGIVRRMYERNPRCTDIVCRINSYLGTLKCSTDMHLMKDYLDSIKDEDLEKDYINWKVKRREMR